MAKKIAHFQFTRKFKKEYQVLPEEIRNNFDKKLILFMDNMFHPSIRAKKIQGTKNRWEGSITMNYRFTLSWKKTE